jgi:hypothetical protein
MLGVSDGLCYNLDELAVGFFGIFGLECPVVIFSLPACAD